MSFGQYNGISRQYGTGGYHMAVAATANTKAIAGNLTLGETWEVRVHATTFCWLRFAKAATGYDAAVPSGDAETASIPIDANRPELLRVPKWATHVSVIRDSADGAITLTPVA